MKNYTLEYTKPLTQVLFLVLYPILALVLFFGALMLFDDFFTDGELIVPSIVAFMLLLLASSLFIVKRYVTIPATLAFDENGMHLQLDRRNMFYSFNSITCGWDNVKNVTGNFDQRTNRHFLSVTFKNPSGSNIMFTINKEDDAQIDIIWKEMYDHIANYNKTVITEAKISTRGFYAGPWMRLLAYAGICMIVSFSIILLYAPSFRTTENVLKLVALMAFLIPFLVNYFQSHKRETHQKK
jgi:hypothetical protein